MSQVYLTAENEEDIRETTNFSVVALFGFFLAMAGQFAIQYIQMMPIAIAGAILGGITLVTAKRRKLGFLSRTLGFLALIAGATTATYGLIYRSLESSYDISVACTTSEMYLDNLSKGELDKVFFLVGFPPGGADEMTPSEQSESPTKRAMNRLRNDPAHKEIGLRKNVPKWVYNGLLGEYSGSDGHTYKLTYRDESQSIPPKYCIFVRKNCSKYDKSKTTVNWFVDKLEVAPNK
jgi:hypothetical protein